MTVVSDTSAISNLQAVGRIDLLETVFGEVMITPAVQRELFRVDSNKNLLEDYNWIKVVSPENQELVLQLMIDLDLGEAPLHFLCCGSVFFNAFSRKCSRGKDGS